MFAAIVDYNMGNIKSVENALRNIPVNVRIAKLPADIKGAHAVILPGVGAFPDAIKNLKSSGLYDAVYNAILNGKPFLGICIGLQLLFENGTEGGHSRGFGVFKGSVEKIIQNVKVPHMGWNKISIIKKNSSIFKNIRNKESFYFVHSYHAKCKDREIISSTTEHGTEIVSSIEHENVYGLQFHPEKSSSCGMAVLKNFIDIAGFK